MEHEIFKMAKEKAIHASTKLFVTMTSDTDAVTDEHREQRVDWCIDNQYEFVYFGMANPIDGMSDAVGGFLFEFVAQRMTNCCCCHHNHRLARA